MRKSAAILCAAFLVIAASSPAAARALGFIPAKTGEFVGFCAKRLPTCREKISQIAAASSCGVPDGVTSKAAARAVLDWLGVHSETFDMLTEEGVRLAFRGVWACANRVGERDKFDAPRSTQKFLVFCKRDFKACEDKIAALSKASRRIRKSGRSTAAAPHCSLPVALDLKPATKAALHWIATHPNMAGSDSDAAIQRAVDTLWPCR